MSDATQMRGVAPVLLVADVVKAAEYYRDRLGFTLPRYWGEPPTFCIVNRDGLFVMLNQVASGDHFRANGSFAGRFDAYFWVRDADALHAEFAAKGANIVCAPEDQPYRQREFQVMGPDGHLLGFGHDTSRAA